MGAEGRGSGGPPARPDPRYPAGMPEPTRSTRDLFGARAREYARVRPTYPEALFDHLEGLAPAHTLAWDVGAGSGQASRSLEQRFAKVVATDTSLRQLAGLSANGATRAFPVAAAAEAAPIRGGTVDLVTVAAAIHWFDRPRFFAEVRRVAKPGAILAAWSYFHAHIDPGVDEVMIRFAEEIVAPYWPGGMQLNRDGYRRIDLPFEVLPWPVFEAEATMTLDDLRKYVSTWSASQAWERERGTDPLAEIDAALARAWGDPAAGRRVVWPLPCAIGRVS